MRKEVLVIAVMALLSLKDAAAVGATPEGTIGVSLTPPSGQIDCGDTLTVTVRLAGYTAGPAIDGCNLYLRYPSNLFEFVPGSTDLGTMSGNSQQWLSKPTQDAGYALVDFTDASIAGEVAIAMTDLGLGMPQGGVTAEAGYLLALTLKSIGVGSGSVSLAPYMGGGGPEVFYDPLLQPVGVPAFANAVVAVRNPLRLSIDLVSTNRIELRWAPTTGVTLESAANVTGPWTPLSGATSPMSIAPAAPRRFYRLSKP